MMEPYQLFGKHSQTFFYNLKGKPIQHMLDFDHLSKREKPSVAAIIHPGKSGYHKVFFGNREILLPIYSSIKEAAEKHPNVDSIINFASFRSAYQSSKEALQQPTIKTVVIVAEGIPERQTKELIAIAKQQQKTIIGPSTVGGIVAGKFRIGHAGGMNENILRARLYRSGSIGLVSRSGGMMNEFFNIISRAADGIHEGIAIGGDAFPGSTLLDHMLRYEANPEIKIIVALGEIGGSMEYEIIEAKKAGKLTKPIVMWVSGTCASIFPWEVQFGHAGAKAESGKETAQAKNAALKEAGIVVPESFEQFEAVIGETFKKHVPTRQPMENPLQIPERKNTHFTSTISDDRGEELTYNGIPISKLITDNSSLGKIIGLLWFKKDLPAEFVHFLDLSLVLCADHGPAVATAHNAMVTARAGKDVISSLIAGLTTIGSRHGGAIDDACRYFLEATGSLKPAEFVEQMKRQGKYIPGIGHRVKSKKNPDKRVELLKQFAKENISSTRYLDYALAVEEETLKKAENLILNVDGCIAAIFLDLLESCGQFNREEIAQITQIGYMNGLFAVGRSVGIIGHILDQRRLDEGLYRHPTDDILYHQ
ncbi:ATP citrate synthase [Candidatus Woesearchaeota archaeon CG10_big_fil_rev_8_21_14_0_10_45_16]|nr:MAG: ATP citrate synthase [Candidatus Woesearchaeota archaeon CG10_big_fil_rev_8_21_14_0_10_45_16]